MTLLIGENGWSLLERITYRGTIGLFYNTTWQGIQAYIIFGLLCLFALIGIICTISWLCFKMPIKKKKKY